MASKVVDSQLREFALLTGAPWSAWVERSGQSWRLCGAFGLAKSGSRSLIQFLSDPVAHAWLSGALSQGRMRNRALTLPGRKSKKVFAFPGSKNKQAILVGADKLDARALKIWRVLALSSPLDEDSEDDGLARSLELIHKVVRRVIGVSDRMEVARIVSDLIAKTFGYELAVVSLADQNRNLIVSGVGGSAGKIVRRGLADLQTQQVDSVTNRVFQTGRSLLLNNVDEHTFYLPIPGWTAGSEMCVALTDSETIYGILDVESSAKDAFTQGDLLVMESLAGILAGVIAGAEHDQKLHETVTRLQEMRQELEATIDAQHETEQRLIQAAKLAAVGEMAAGVAHELNNPMTTVVGFTEMILSDLPEDSPYRMDLSLVLRESRRAVNVVRRLLDFSRQTESVRVRADMNELVEETLALTRHLLRADGIDVSFHAASDLPWVLVDRNQIKQVILNLISNAQHAMPSGGRLILETLPQKMHGQDGVSVMVQDTGVGIPQENLTRIFEPFFTTRGDHGGTGLGLSVTYGIVSEHRGVIEVESTINSGSTFKVWLPLETPAA